MSKRNDITDGIFATTKKYGLVYTEELGWIDLGHAQGQDARILKRKLEQEHFSTYYDEFHDWYFPVDYHQEMGIRKKILGVDLTFHTGVYTKVMVRSCLSPTLKARVALTLMYGTAKRFEAWQNSFIFNWYTDSGFSLRLDWFLSCIWNRPRSTFIGKTFILHKSLTNMGYIWSAREF
ncbi:hypothetical protein [Escherichia coli]|uniref:hypothetical protein n=1 Tax=Escherichia coli TaxID=562 RepID=UPI002076FD71|nr:hypothetical protein [Escherichia coli]